MISSPKSKHASENALRADRLESLLKQDRLKVGEAVTKSELIARLAERLNERGTPLAARDCEFAVKTLLDAMTEALGHRHRIEIRGFGTFSFPIVLPALAAIPSRGPRSGFPKSACRISSLARIFASALIFPLSKRR